MPQQNLYHLAIQSLFLFHRGRMVCRQKYLKVYKGCGKDSEVCLSRSRPVQGYSTPDSGWMALYKRSSKLYQHKKLYVTNFVIRILLKQDISVVSEKVSYRLTRIYSQQQSALVRIYNTIHLFVHKTKYAQN